MSDPLRSTPRRSISDEARDLCLEMYRTMPTFGQQAAAMAWLEGFKDRLGTPSETAFGVYVASRVVRAPLWRAYRDRGIPITASWIDEAGEGETGDFGELWQRIRSEISRSNALVFYAAGVEDFPFKGALVEVGMALAMGKKVFTFIDNVMLDGRTMRPVGSWLLDRNVKQCDSLDEAMLAAMEAEYA